MGFFNGVWKGIKTGFGAVTGSESVYYPDNEDREERVNDLYNQNSRLFNEANNAVTEISNQLSIFNDLEVDYLVDQLSFSDSWKGMNTENILHEISLNNIHEIFVMQALAMKDKGSSKLDVIELPLDMKMFSIGGVPVFIPAGGVVGGSISGAVKRSKLRGAIHDHINTRKSLIKTVLTLRNYNEQFSTAIPNTEHLEHLGINASDIINQTLQEVKAIIYLSVPISDTDVLAMSTELDLLNDSWT